MGTEHSQGKINVSLAIVIALVLLFALMTFRLKGGPDLKDVFGSMMEKMRLSSEVRVNLLKSQENEKNAVMADTDEASREFADRSRHAADTVDQDLRELGSLLSRDHTNKEMGLFQEFNSCWTELRKIDQRILDFAVRNTNLKAAALSFGKGHETMGRFDRALRNLIHSALTGNNCCDVVTPASDALSAGFRILSLHDPHIASASDVVMGEIETEMRMDGEIVDTSLEKLADLVSEKDRASLQEAKAAYDDFSAVTAEVIKLSRENTNVKSFELSLGKKRKVAAQCDEILIGLQEAVRAREFKATR